ncbi:DUF481 domain-containing protein [Desulfatitalea alkaliphila]|uniref:DUF481 domain-containing protein n=1 Tax=Desulfatitalea alkaliphila TaxID=2929485 RepID=A0AA41UIT1_9BACT|nr:DUF481 domain-containing protein [Desulfatitalea alkaliphila]MCJ8499857.1 DUF481 domain-containing protein [Desulfatitalea alkaliphila]
MLSLSRIPAFCLACLLSLAAAAAAPAAEPNHWRRFAFELEVGPVWQTRNDVRIPGDTGTEFSLKDLTGSGPYPAGRITLDWNIRQRHGLRFIVAPFQFDGKGSFDRSVSFSGGTFAPGTSTKGTYKFNTYRAGYRYLFFNTDAWQMRVGATILVRDAKIELEQNGISASDSDFGFAPLLNFSAQWAFAPRWTAILDFEGLAGGPGRALDLSLKVRYALNDHWSVGAGYRTLEGGADSDDVYNFSWFHYALLTLGYQF